MRISVKNSAGFVVNRILVPMIDEAFFVLAEGARAGKLTRALSSERIILLVRPDYRFV
ncbi:3-hydroxyacyl-CoA dehydrogenase family protein [Paraburkholderia caledonica]|uniref:3-hydroxyacyl-CoA dehydrogenase family protein n=1 Tax=Paraburkholderia caledonica TaxID=134536 RepID=UPI0038CD34BF